MESEICFWTSSSLSRTLTTHTYAPTSDRIWRERWTHHSHNSYLITGEAREAFGTPLMGLYGVEINDVSLRVTTLDLSRMELVGSLRHPECDGM